MARHFRVKADRSSRNVAARAALACPAACKCEAALLKHGAGETRRQSTVAHVGRDREHRLGAHAEPLKTLIPALDHAAGAQLEVERLAAATRRVELLARRARCAVLVDGALLRGRL